MKPKVRPIKDLYFRLIEGTSLDGTLNAQDAAVVLAQAKLIELIPHESRPTIEHYRDLEGMRNADSIMDTLVNNLGEENDLI